MGMDQYIMAIRKGTEEVFPMLQLRKHYALHEMIVQREGLNTSDCVVSCPLTHELVDYLIEYAPDKEDRNFFAYLKYHMNTNTSYVGDYDDAVKVMDYAYSYQADW